MSNYSGHYSSPMEDVFSWNISGHGDQTKNMGDDGGGKNSSLNKRRCDEDDSGYATTPSFSKSRSLCTPTTVVNECSSPLSAVNRVKCRPLRPHSIEAFSELLTEASLYNEPMDVSEAEPRRDSSPGIKSLCPCNEEIVDLVHSSTCTPTLSPETPKSSRISSPVKRLNFFPLSPLSPVKRTAHRRRFLNGFEHLDILYFLGIKMSLPHIVDRILCYLNGEDLSSVRLVSKSWKDVSGNAVSARNVWLQHVGHVMINKENIGCGSSWSSSKRGTPLVVFNHSTPFQERQPRTPPSSPSKFTLFRKAAQQLRHNQNLMHCPRCRGPSACTPDQHLAECVSPLCLYRFCSDCKRIPHIGSCPELFSSSPPSTPPKRVPSVCSKKSRRNLRRL